ncbi:hypothetical protein L2C91_13500 [Rosenbergiella epipactidis]|uniref:hypothetical protein n=1 Tax=Rosenbergiella epipactidis TaxID=1544694 RepID=UPI0020263E19|nr:hypothetical protein [Rosenbergiella epipactidis]MCL9669381.1 hypothetical protein [Rosenbergiella epipactidis]
MYLDESGLNSKLKGLWLMLKGQGLMSHISLEDIEKKAKEKGILIYELKDVKFGYQGIMEGVLLKSDVGTIILPRTKIEDVRIYQKNIEPIKKIREFWKAVDWFIPTYINNGKLHDALKFSGATPKDIQYFDKLKFQEMFDYAFPQIYDLSTIIPITMQLLPKSTSFSKHLPIIREAILAFYSGMKVSATASLIPIIEDVIRSIIGVESRYSDNFSNINNCINKACLNVLLMDIHNAEWIPREYCEEVFLITTNERILILETIRDWLLNSFYVDTKKYSNYSGFNRHHFAHSLSSIWHHKTNFFRAIGLIQALAFVEIFAVKDSKLSLLIPSWDENSESFHLEILVCLELQAEKNMAIAAIQSREGLPHSCTASDDGWMLRSAILSEKMDKDIIENLKNKGWQCYNFEDPVKEGEYITVDAKKDMRSIKVALLYTCVTSREIYLALQNTCDFILFQGASYRINEFTHGLIKEVQPLSAWLAPD